MAPLGPWDGARRVAVAVSGGADSLALALLAAQWGDPVALIVDHGVRPRSAAEAEMTRRQLAARSIPAQVLTLTGLAPGSRLPARARAARYGALEQAAAALGLVDLLLGHHAGDQAETVLMRQRSGSGTAGLAGMAAVREGLLVRRVRPLLGVAARRLRATVRAAGLDWVEDPTNQDMAFTRARVRAELAGSPGQPRAKGQDQGAARAAAEAALAAVLAERVSLFPEGHAVLTAGPIEPAALAAVLRTVAGRDFAPASTAVAALAAAPRAATLGGVQIRPAGRLGPGWLLVREASAMAAAVPWADGTVWDGRFQAAGGAAPGAELGALGSDAAAFRDHTLPLAVLRTLAAVRRDGVLVAVPSLDYHGCVRAGERFILHPCASPACGALFMA